MWHWDGFMVGLPQEKKKMNNKYIDNWSQGTAASCVLRTGSAPFSIH